MSILVLLQPLEKLHSLENGANFLTHLVIRETMAIFSCAIAGKRTLSVTMSPSVVLCRQAKQVDTLYRSEALRVRLVVVYNMSIRRSG